MIENPQQQLSELNKKQRVVLEEVVTAYNAYNMQPESCDAFMGLNRTVNARTGFTNFQLRLSEVRQLDKYTQGICAIAKTTHKKAVPEKSDHKYGCPVAGIPAALDKRVQEKIFKRMGY